MKFLLLFFYLGQVCAPAGSPVGPPPYYYMRAYDTQDEALAAKEELPEGAIGTIVYGKPGFNY